MAVAARPSGGRDEGDSFVSPPVTQRAAKAAAKLSARRSVRGPNLQTPSPTPSPPQPPAAAVQAAAAGRAGAGARQDLGVEMDEEEILAAARAIVARRRGGAGRKSQERARTVPAKTPPRPRSSGSGSASSLAGASRSGTRGRGRPTSTASSSSRSLGGASTDSRTPEGRTPLKKLPLSVGRQKGSSNDDKSSDGRRNLDKRTARLRYSADFVADVARHAPRSPTAETETGAGAGTSSLTGTGIGVGPSGVQVYVRKRPIFQYELDRSDFDILRLERSEPGGASQELEANTVVVSNCAMHADMRRMLVRELRFPCTRAFGEGSTQGDIYDGIAGPMVANAAGGGVSTILMFGQTGSGKTHTMTGIEERAAKGIFDRLAEAEADGGGGAVVAVQFVELSGKSCKCLLSDDEEEVSLAEQKDGSVRLLNAESVGVGSADELADAIALGKSRRATEATDVNGVSSRSHAVCQVQITFQAQEGQRRRERGLLNLLDLAGSERRNDTMYHTSNRQKESTEINASLWALKECTRAKKDNKSLVPYRQHNLTRLLRESFERDSARLAIIATVAPNATDTEHTIETLKFVANIGGMEKNIIEGAPREVDSASSRKKSKVPVPKQYSHKQLVEFLKRKKIKVDVPARIDGKAIMRMSAQQIGAHCFDGSPSKSGTNNEIFNALRSENDRANKLNRRERMSLSETRKGEPLY